MSGNLQPKGLFELAFRSFITYMDNEARQLMKLDPTPEAVALTSRVCKELERFFHGVRLPTFLTNQLTKHLLMKLDFMHYMFDSSIRTESGRQMLLSLVEVFMHPDVTAIEVGPSYFYGSDFTPCNFITCAILTKVCNLHNLKVLNLPAVYPYHFKKHALVFPSQLKELTVRESRCYSCEDVLRSIVESCPELKGLTMYEWVLSEEIIPLILQCKHLETLRLTKSYDTRDDFYVTLINGLSTDATNDVLSASTLKSFHSNIGDQNTLNLIVDKLPHLTEIELVCEGNIDLSNLTQLKNLQSLSLEALYDETPIEYKKILPVLGKNLKFLGMKGDGILDLEFIAETCTHLKCFHVKCSEVISSSKAFQNFKTVECLKVGFREDENDMAAFLIAQCTNIKTLTVDISYIEGALESPLYRTIEDVIRRTPALDWILIQHTEYDDFIESLFSRHPNFHINFARYWTRLSSQLEVFDSFECYDSL